MLRHGLRPATPADLALVCASHYGQESHIARVRAMLAAAGLAEDALQCPPDLPLDQEPGRRCCVPVAARRRCG